MNGILPVFALTLLSALFATAPAFCGQTAEARFEAQDGSQLCARFDISGKRVQVTLPDGVRLTLPLALSASGARYSDGRATFWEHHGDVRVERDGKLVFQGRDAALLERERPVRLAASEYLRSLARNDASFAGLFPPEPTPSGLSQPEQFRCRLHAGQDTGQDAAPWDARCVLELEDISADGPLASVRWAAVPADAVRRGQRVQSHEALWLLLHRGAAGHWRGVAWFSGPGQPALGGEAAQSLGVSSGELETVGWRLRTP